jgi:hypothetical protein
LAGTQLLKAYKPTIHPVSFVRELVLCVHTILRLLETFCQEQETLYVKKKRRGKPKRRKGLYSVPWVLLAE